MANLARLGFPNKATGDTFTATELNEIKIKLNLLIDAFNLLPTATGTGVVIPPVVQSNLLTPATTDYWYNSGIVRPSGGQTIHAALSMLKINLNGATSVSINSINTGAGSVTILDGTTVIGGMNTTNPYTFSGLSGGVLTLLAGAEQRSYEQGDVQGSDVLNITLGGGILGNLIAPVQATTAIVVIGDSISNGSGASQPQITGWTALLRNGNTRATYVTGYGSSQGVVIGAQANWINLKAQISAALAGATNKVIVWALGSNDAMGASGPGACTLADYMVSFNAFLTNTQNDFAGISRIIFTPILRRGEATIVNGYGWHMSDLRTAETQAASGKPVTLVLDGLPVCADADISGDGAHPFDSGHTKISNAVLAAVNNVITGVYTPAVVTPTPTPVTAGTVNITWVQPAANGGAVGNGIIYQTYTSPLWGGGFNATQHFTYPTASSDSVIAKAPNQTINRSLGSKGGVLYGLSNVVQDGDYMKIRHAWYWDGTLVRVFELGVKLYEAALPAGNPTFEVKATSTGIQYLLNGSAITLNTASVLAVPSGDFWVTAALSTVGDATGTGSNVTGAQLVSATTTTTPTPTPTPTETSVVWSSPAMNGGAIGTGIIYQASTSPLWGGGFNATQHFTYPTSGYVSAKAASQTINRSLGSKGGVLYGLSNVVQDGDYTKLRHAWYWDGLVVRVFELGVKLYEATLPAGNPTFEVKATSTGIQYLLNGTAITLTTASTIGIPSGDFWITAALSTPGDATGTGSNVKNATMVVG